MVKERLTPREEQVLRHVRTGASNKDIADSLKISEQAVKALVSRLLLKYGVPNRTSLATNADAAPRRTGPGHTLSDAIARSRDLRDHNHELMDELRREVRSFRSVRARLIEQQDVRRARTTGANPRPSPRAPRPE